jgi:hypothetical protein
MRVHLAFLLSTWLVSPAFAQSEPMTTPTPPPAVTAWFVDSSSHLRGPHSFTWNISGVTPQNLKLKLDGNTIKEKDTDQSTDISYSYNLGYLEPRVGFSYENTTSEDQSDNSKSDFMQQFFRVGSDLNFIKNEKPNNLIPFANLSLGYLKLTEDSGTDNNNHTTISGNGIILMASLGLKWFPADQDIFAVIANVSWQTALNGDFDADGSSSGTPFSVSGDADLDTTGYAVAFSFYF